MNNPLLAKAARTKILPSSKMVKLLKLLYSINMPRAKVKSPMICSISSQMRWKKNKRVLYPSSIFLIALGKRKPLIILVLHFLLRSTATFRWNLSKVRWLLGISLAIHFASLKFNIWKSRKSKRERKPQNNQEIS